jgi:cytochrome c-type biogenesis protein CcmH/NrfG
MSATRLGVAVMAVLLALYIVLVAQRGWLLVTSDEPVAIAMGAALLLLPVLGAWALWREVRFGTRAQALAKRLEAEGALPSEELDVRASGRPIREQADALYPAYRADVEQHPDDWRAWFRLGLLYDGAGDRSRARRAVRTAIALERAEP